MAYESQKIQQTSMADLIQLVQGLQRNNQNRQVRRKASQNDMYSIYTDELKNNYDKDRVGEQKLAFSKYYEDNKDGMDDDTIAKFDMLNEKFKNRDEDIDSFTNGSTMMRQYGEDVEGILHEYSGVDEQTEFLDEDGYSIVIQDNLHLEKLRNEKRLEVGSKYKDKMLAFSEFESNFGARHGVRLSTKFGSKENLMLTNLGDIFAFGMAQAKDDGLFDEREAEAYQAAVLNGSPQSIINYNNNEANINRQLSTKQSTELDGLYENTNIMWKYISDFNTWDELDANAKADKAEDVLFTLEDGTNITYEEAAETDSEGGILFKQYQNEVSSNLIKMGNVDKNYTRMQGNSYLETINTGTETFKSMISGLNQPFATKPKGPTTTQVTPKQQLPYGQINSANYTTSNNLSITNMTKYKATANAFVNKVNKEALSITAWNTSREDMLKDEEKLTKEIGILRDEDIEMKNLGLRYFSKERKEIRKKLNSLRTKHESLWLISPGNIPLLKKQAEKGDIPVWYPELAAEAWKKGISMNKYVKYYMNTPEFDKFLDKRLDILNQRYDIQKERLDKIIAKGSDTK